MLHVDGLKNGGPSAKEIPLGAFLGACHFDAEILSFKIIWLEALFDAPKRIEIIGIESSRNNPLEPDLSPESSDQNHLSGTTHSPSQRQ